MRIQKIRIENYKSIKDMTIDFSQTVSVLVGPNDHGKTNILCAVRDFFNVNLLQEETLKTTDNFYKNKKRRDSASSPLRISVLITGLPKGLRVTKAKLSKIALTLQFMANGEVRCNLNRDSLQAPKRNHSKKAFEKYLAIKSALNVVYVPTFRNIESHLQDFDEDAALYSLIARHLGQMLETQKGGTSAEYRAIAKIQEKVDALVRRSFKDVEKQVAAYLPSSSRVKVEFGFLKNNGDSDSSLRLSRILAQEVFVKNSADGNPITELGSGIQQAVLIGLLEKNLIRPNKNNILLFEEPESFLHPNAQRELFAKLVSLSSRSGNQGIFTTHSPAVVDACELISVIVVRKDSDSGVTQAYAFLDSDHRSFTLKDYEKLDAEKTFRNSELFFSEYVILVEGPSDQHAIKEVLAKCFPFQAHQCSVIEVGGATRIDTLVNIVRSYGTDDNPAFRWVAVLDKDTLLAPFNLQKTFKKLFPGNTIDWVNLEKRAKALIPMDGQNINRNAAELCARAVNKEISTFRFLVNPADIEFLMVCDSNFKTVRDFLLKFYPEESQDIQSCSTCDDLSRLLCSKGPNLGTWSVTSTQERKWKKPHIIKAVAKSTKKEDVPSELLNLVTSIVKVLQS